MKTKTKPELKRSFTETDNLDMNLEEELRDLKKVIETQKKKNLSGTDTLIWNW